MVKAGYNGRLHGQVTFPPAETEFLKNGILGNLLVPDPSAWKLTRNQDAQSERSREMRDKPRDARQTK